MASTKTPPVRPPTVSDAEVQRSLREMAHLVKASIAEARGLIDGELTTVRDVDPRETARSAGKVNRAAAKAVAKAFQQAQAQLDSVQNMFQTGIPEPSEPATGSHDLDPERSAMHAVHDASRSLDHALDVLIDPGKIRVPTFGLDI